VSVLACTILAIVPWCGVVRRGAVLCRRWLLLPLYLAMVYERYREQSKSQLQNRRVKQYVALVEVWMVWSVPCDYHRAMFVSLAVDCARVCLLCTLHAAFSSSSLPIHLTRRVSYPMARSCLALLRLPTLLPLTTLLAHTHRSVSLTHTLALSCCALFANRRRFSS
jgi:hypothetical protein